MKCNCYMLKRILALAIFLLLPITSSYAQASNKDIATISKAISFMQNGPKGTLNVAIAYDPSDKESFNYASEVEEALASPVGSGRVKLLGKKVPVQSLNKNNDYKVIFVTKGLVSKYKKILEDAQNRGIITVSTDVECLDRGGCLLTVETNPNVEISMNTKVADRTGIRFESAFRMMIIKK